MIMKPPSATHVLLSSQVRSAISNQARIPRTSRLARTTQACTSKRRYAQVGSTTYLGQPPSSPDNAPVPPHTSTSSPSTHLGPASSTIHNSTTAIKSFDTHVLSELQKPAQPEAPSITLPDVIEQYMRRAGRVLDTSLPYESRPGAARRATFTPPEAATAASTADGALALVAHAVLDRTGKHRVAYSSGFALDVPGLRAGESVYVTCAHTLEEVSLLRSRLSRKKQRGLIFCRYGHPGRPHSLPTTL